MVDDEQPTTDIEDCPQRTEQVLTGVAWQDVKRGNGQGSHQGDKVKV
jgi:hypothetical protein